jgi:hypothetical protein
MAHRVWFNIIGPTPEKSIKIATRYTNTENWIFVISFKSAWLKKNVGSI